MSTPTKFDLAQVVSRRGFLADMVTGLAGIGLADLIGNEAVGDPSGSSLTDWRPGLGRTHLPAKARRVLQIFCPGAASHMDLWEHKPELERWHGKPLPGAEEFVSFQGKNGNLMNLSYPISRT